MGQQQKLLNTRGFFCAPNFDKKNTQLGREVYPGRSSRHVFESRINRSGSPSGTTEKLLKNERLFLCAKL